MSFRLGIVGLCISHPANWIPIIRQLSDEGFADIEITAVWDSGEVQPRGFAKKFCCEHNIAMAPDSLEEMRDMVDGVTVHTANWDKHIQHAEPFVKAGKSVFIDKPVTGCIKDYHTLLDWEKKGERITGGSSLRYTSEISEFLKNKEEKGKVQFVYGVCGSDEFNYGIHMYSLVSSIIGPGIQSVRYLGSSGQKHIQLAWKKEKAIISVGHGKGLPFQVMIVTDETAEHILIDNGKIYRSLLKKVLPYLIGRTDKPPYTMRELLEPELAAIAAKKSWTNGGEEIFLVDLKTNDPAYDGTQFAEAYREKKFQKK